MFLGLFTVFSCLSQALSFPHQGCSPRYSPAPHSTSWVPECGPGCCVSAAGRLAFRSPQSPPAWALPPHGTCRPFPDAFVNQIVNSQHLSEANFSLNSPRPPALQPGGSCSFPGADIRQDLLLPCAKFSVPQPP